MRSIPFFLLAFAFVACAPSDTPLEQEEPSAISLQGSEVDYGPAKGYISEELRDDWVPPISNAQHRVLKKPFGLFVSPENSPVQPERFSGYHTGTDFELLEGEDPHAVTVHAACKGDVIFADRVNGYGGVVVQQCMHEGEPVTVLYGHLSLDAITAEVSQSLRVGESIGVLGTGFSEETDGERPHLHFSVHRGGAIELKGYTDSKEGLLQWVDWNSL